MDKQEIDWGGLAFPHEYELPAGEVDANGDSHDEDLLMIHHGIALREYAAVRAMQSLIIVINEDRREADEPEWVANRSVQYADALIKRLGEDDVSE